jgi:hypothetical protein
MREPVKVRAVTVSVTSAQFAVYVRNEALRELVALAPDQTLAETLDQLLTYALLESRRRRVQQEVQP